MAQENWNETGETECQTPTGPVLCINNCGFFGSSVTNNLCSKCYRDLVMNQQAVVAMPVHVAEKKLDIASPSVPFEPALVELKKPEGTNADQEQEQERLDDVSKKQAANRCLACSKRVRLAGFKCRCGGTFCSAHRYSETHNCLFDYKSAGREAIAKENPVVKAEKIEKI